MDNPPKYRYQAPTQHGQTLLVPGLPQMLRDLQNNIDSLSAAGCRILSRPLAGLRPSTRTELLAQAVHYHRLLQLPPLEPVFDQPLIVTGHQPGFHHPGILIKYLLAHHLAQSAGSVALNLIVDSDLPPSLSLPLPVHTPNGLTIQNIPLADFNPALPWQDQPLPTPDQLHSFLDQLEHTDVPAPIAPALKTLSGTLTECLPLSNSVPVLFTLLHRRLAAPLAIQWLDLPVSLLSQSESFARFACDLILRAPEFHRCYNLALEDFRRAGKIRNASQPLPNLKGSHESGQPGRPLELPLWLFAPRQPRRPLFICVQNGDILIRDHQSALCRLPAGLLADPEQGPAALPAALRAHRLQLRPRALALTAFTRLFLADYFIHGIGGAVYDQVTDRLIRMFYRIAPPAFACASATLHLPLGQGAPPDQISEQIRQTRHTLRDLDFNPQRYLADALPQPPAEAAHLEKLQQDRLQAIQTDDRLRQFRAAAELRRQNFQQLRRLNQQLKMHLGPLDRRLRITLADLEHRLHQARLTHHREFPFVLFSPEQLQILAQSLPPILDQP